MSALTVAAVRQRVAALVEAVASPVAFHESRWDLVSGTEPQNEAHGAFAVVSPATVFGSPIESSRRSRTIGAVQTAITVRWLYRLRAEAYVADFDLALAAEAAAYTAITSDSDSADLRIVVLSMAREVVGDGLWLRGEIAIRTDHHLSLS